MQPVPFAIGDATSGLTQLLIARKAARESTTAVFVQETDAHYTPTNKILDLMLERYVADEAHLTTYSGTNILKTDSTVDTTVANTFLAEESATEIDLAKVLAQLLNTKQPEEHSAFLTELLTGELAGDVSTNPFKTAIKETLTDKKAALTQEAEAKVNEMIENPGVRNAISNLTYANDETSSYIPVARNSSLIKQIIAKQIEAAEEGEEIDAEAEAVVAKITADVAAIKVALETVFENDITALKDIETINPTIEVTVDGGTYNLPIHNPELTQAEVLKQYNALTGKNDENLDSNEAKAFIKLNNLSTLANFEQFKDKGQHLKAELQVALGAFQVALAADKTANANWLEKIILAITGWRKVDVELKNKIKAALDTARPAFKNENAGLAEKFAVNNPSQIKQEINRKYGLIHVEARPVGNGSLKKLVKKDTPYQKAMEGLAGLTGQTFTGIPKTKPEDTKKITITPSLIQSKTTTGEVGDKTVPQLFETPEKVSYEDLLGSAFYDHKGADKQDDPKEVFKNALKKEDRAEFEALDTQHGANFETLKTRQAILNRIAKKISEHTGDFADFTMNKTDFFDASEIVFIEGDIELTVDNTLSYSALAQLIAPLVKKQEALGQTLKEPMGQMIGLISKANANTVIPNNVEPLLTTISTVSTKLCADPHSSKGQQDENGDVKKDAGKKRHMRKAAILHMMTTNPDVDVNALADAAIQKCTTAKEVAEEQLVANAEANDKVSPAERTLGLNRTIAEADKIIKQCRILQEICTEIQAAIADGKIAAEQLNDLRKELSGEIDIFDDGALGAKPELTPKFIATMLGNTQRLSGDLREKTTVILKERQAEEVKMLKQLVADEIGEDGDAKAALENVENKIVTKVYGLNDENDDEFVKAKQEVHEKYTSLSLDGIVASKLTPKDRASLLEQFANPSIKTAAEARTAETQDSIDQKNAYQALKNPPAASSISGSGIG